MDILATYKIVVVSDLHLSEGWDGEGFLSKKEDFFFDANFRRFLEYLSSEAKKGGFYYKLVINGDFVDFLQFSPDPKKNDIDGEPLSRREQKLGPGTTRKKTLWKLKRLIGGHSGFFCALADFVSQGNELLIIPGNHDIEWMMPTLQDALRQELQTLCTSSSGIIGRIKFQPWFYWDPSMSVFIEHGSQYDDINSFDYLLCPYRDDDMIDLPAGSFFVRYLFNRLEEIYPFADNMKPMSKFIVWALFRSKTYIGWPPRIVRLFQFFIDTLRKAGPINKNLAERLKQRQETELQGLAAGSGLSQQALSALKEYWVPSSLHHKSRPSLALRFFTNSNLDKYYYRKMAVATQKATAARYIVFGHTHEADLYGLGVGKDGTKQEYVNSGGWTKCFAGNYEEALLKSENEFVYVHIGRDDRKQQVKMDLFRWNDELHIGERVRLFK